MNNKVDVFLSIMTMTSIMCSRDKLTPEVAEFANLLLANLVGIPPLIRVPRPRHIVNVTDLPEIEIEQWTG